MHRAGGAGGENSDKMHGRAVSIPQWLRLREGSSNSKRRRVARLELAPRKYSLDDCVGMGHPATKSVMLGFTHDGERLISYTRNGFAQPGLRGLEDEATDYALELWQFTPRRKIWCVARYPLFRTEDGPTDFGSTDMFDSVPASLSVTQKCGLTLVQACATDNMGGEMVGSQPGEETGRKNTVSVVMGDSLPSQEIPVTVCHIGYMCNAPYPRLNPALSLLPNVWCQGPPGGFTLLLNTGDSIRTVAVLSRFGAPSHAPFGDLPPVDVKFSRRLPFEACPLSEDEGEWQAVQGSFDAEAHVHSLMLEINKPGGSYEKDRLEVVDYDIELIDAASSGGRLGGESVYAAVGVSIVLAGSSSWQGGYRSMSQLVLLDVRTGKVKCQLSTRLKECSRCFLQGQSDSKPGYTQAWESILSRQVRGVEGRNIYMDNEALMLGRCVERLENPMYPIYLSPPT